MAQAWMPVALAPFIGSFVATVAIRIPLGETVVLGRSHCRACGHVLGWEELIPLLSWLAQRGQCRHCGGSIAASYPIVELLLLGVAVWGLLVVPAPILWWSCLLGWTLIGLALIDWRHFILPDALTLPLAGAGLLATAFIVPDALSDHLLAAVLGLGAFALIRVLYRAFRGREGLGMGDAKLMAAAGAWLGIGGLTSVVLLGAIAGLLWSTMKALRGNPLSTTGKIPFGTFLAGAIWITWLYGPVSLGWLGG